MARDTVDPASMPRYPSSGLSILIVGGGIGGLSFAIEAYRKGHSVRVIERRPDYTDAGDIIAVQASALHTPKYWPGFLERCQESPYSGVGHVYKHDGTLLGNTHTPLGIHRVMFHGLLHEYVERLGIEIKFGTQATSYFETDDFAGVGLTDGTKLTADIVVAADGVGSKSWKIVTGFNEEPVSSGFAIFRAKFPAKEALQNPALAEQFLANKARLNLIIGPGAHMVIGFTGEEFVFLLTHKDTGDSSEEWSKLTSVNNALPYVKGWVPYLTDLLKAAPGGQAVDFKLMWRDPRDKWASPKGRVIQIGDAAHAFLPTSASGATMALEDSFSLATCLQLSGKSNAPLAVKVHNHLRAERVSCAQKMGLKNRELYHNTNWEAMGKDHSRLLKMVGRWVANHDAEKYAYENYGNCVNYITMGVPFKNTNAVPGHTYKPWTIRELLDASERGEPDTDDGEWI